MNGFQRFQQDERARAVARVIEHLHTAHFLLRAAEHENSLFRLGLQLPPEKLILDAINHCAHVYKQPPEAQG